LGTGRCVTQGGLETVVYGFSKDLKSAFLHNSIVKCIDYSIFEAPVCTKIHVSNHIFPGSTPNY